MLPTAVPVKRGRGRAVSSNVLRNAAFFIIVLNLLPGCFATAVRNSVGVEMIRPDSVARTRLDAREVFLMPAAVDAPMPMFPHGVTADDARANVCVEVVVSEDGRVVGINPLVGQPECDDLEHVPGRQFYDEVKSAVERWSFIGAAVCRYVEPEEECGAGSADLRPVPVKLAYRFEFAVSNGKPSVLSRATRK